MKQVFNAGIAERYGIVAAVLAEHMWREVKENEFHGRHRYGGNVWMRCSMRAFTAAMTYLSEGMVYIGIQKLINEGVLMRGKNSGSGHGRAEWYAFTASGKKLMEESEDEDYE